MEHLKMHSLNKIDENISKIAALFPNCVTEAKDDNGEIVHKIDFDMLKQELSNTLVEGREERYQFTWPDKKQAILTANAPINKTLRPCREESVDFDNTENLYIEGDNLEALKLLQETYLGKIKMIYIDPPYNTGNDFVYEDDFAQDAADYIANSGQTDKEGNRLVANTESNGRFHTDWLNMIYPRLKLARDLLSDDGYICISIDDNEVENVKKLCNEVFGQANFVAQFIIVRSEGGGLAKRAVIGHDYMVVFAKSIENCRPLGRPKDIRGKIVNKNGEDYWIETDWFREVFGKYGTCHYEDILKFYSQTKKDEIDEGIKKGNYILIPRDGKHIVGRYRKVADDTSKFYTILKHLNKNGVADLHNLELDSFFDYPKPVSLIKDFVQGVTITSKNNSDIILDFFSGSATTAHAVMQLNAEDGGNRKFIMVQLPEITDEKSEAFKASYKNICEIGKERIRRAGQQILNAKKSAKDVSPEQIRLSKNNEQTDLFASNDAHEKTDNYKLDIGFRVLKIDSTNMEDVYYTPDHFNAKDLFKDNIKKDRTGEDLLFQVMLDLGILLSSKIETKKINGKEVFFVEGNYLVACFDDSVDEATVTEIAKEKPYYFVMRDPSNAQDGDSLVTNFEQIFATYSPDTIRKVL